MGNNSESPFGRAKDSPASFDGFELFHDMPEGGSLKDNSSEGCPPVQEEPSPDVSSILDGTAHRYRDALLKNHAYKRDPVLDRSLVPEKADAIRKAHPHVHALLVEAWGVPELFHLQLARLLVVEKDRASRQGFSDEVEQEMQVLRNNHDRLFGHPPERKRNDPFEHHNAK